MYKNVMHFRSFIIGRVRGYLFFLFSFSNLVEYVR